MKLQKGEIAIFFVTILYFFYQYFFHFSWDIMTYVLNSQSLFGQGHYYEVLRAPLMPLIMGILQVFGWKLAEIIFIILVTIFFFYTMRVLAKSLKFDTITFLLIFISWYMLHYSVSRGTELLSLSLLMLGIAYMFNKKAISGVFVGLAAIARYNSAIYAIFLLFNDKKKIIPSLIFFTIPLFLWGLYNRLVFGNFFTSHADLYALNVTYRHYAVEAFPWLKLLGMFSICIPFIILGLINAIKKIKDKKNIVFLLILIFNLLYFIKLPTKDMRYLFNIILPVAYFCYLGIHTVGRKFKIKARHIAIGIFILNLLFLACAEMYAEHPQDKIYKDTFDVLDKNCSTISNGWIMLNYYGMPTKKIQRAAQVPIRISEGERIVLFPKLGEPAYASNDSFLEQFPILYRNDDVIILGNGKCLPHNVKTETYLEELDRYIFEIHGYHINTNPCMQMFRKIALVEKACNLLNYGRFSIDKNRVIE